MGKSGYTLARQVSISLPVDELDRVLRSRSAPAALVYLALQRTGGKLPRAEELHLSGEAYQSAIDVLRGAGILKSAEKPLPDTRTLPEYTTEELLQREQAFHIVVAMKWIIIYSSSFAQFHSYAFSF